MYYQLHTHSSQVCYFLNLAFDKALPTKPRVHRHYQDQINR